jgi:glycosyltransferase involved in cell wall biosynthesis
MNNKKVCFIACVNDEAMYQESVLYIKHLKIPKGFEIDFIPIRDAKYMTKAYNQAMQTSDAKYKVYLHQDVFIIHKNFIIDILKIFECDDKIGMIGVAGAEKIPTVACWWEASKQHVSVYDNTSGKMGKADRVNCTGDYAKVAAIDGLIMVTQYDVLWREDIFDDWHFYDISQSVEFAKCGYQIIVPNQLEPWCIHDCGLLELDKAYEKYRNVFLNEYSTFLFPLVSILIPTYNRPEYFKIAFESAINQTYRNIEVIVCDNSSNEETAEFMKPYLNNSKVTYLRNRNKTKEENFQQFKDITHGEYINWLMDDDVFDFNKIIAMMQIYLECDEVSLVTSYCQSIDEQGNRVEQIMNFRCEEPSIFDGRKFGKDMLLNMTNFIGKTTAVLFKRKLLESQYWNAEFRGYKAIPDVAMWLELLSKGSMVYIAGTLSSFYTFGALSSFRRYEQQEQDSMNTVLLSRIEWFKIVKEAYQIGYFIDNIEEYRSVLLIWIKDSVGLLENAEKVKNEVDEKIHNQYIKVLLEAKKYF